MKVIASILTGCILLVSSAYVNAAPFEKIVYAKEETKISLNRETMIYIMAEDQGWQVVEQCTRSVYYPDLFWRVTNDQVEAIEKRLKTHLKKLAEKKAEFVPEDLENYKRQYIGYTLNGVSYIYGNYFPKNAKLEVDPIREGVVSCRGDKRYWASLFNIETFKFEAIEPNDKLVKPKGAIDPNVFPPDEPPAY